MTIKAAVDGLGSGPLTEALLREHVFGLFGRVLEAEKRRGEIYLANHSLGRPLDRTAEDIAAAVSLWYTDMDGAWGAWMQAAEQYRASVARLIGCANPAAVVPKTSAGQGLRAVLNALPDPRPRVVATSGEFDSIDFILRTYQRKQRADVVFVPPDERGMFHADAIAASLTPQTDLLVVSQVVFSTGQVLRHLDELINKARGLGIIVLVDTYHSAGTMTVGFDRLGADFAIGGNYKYTRGGPGACWLAVADRHLRPEGAAPQDALFTLDTGWFAKRDTFGFARPHEPELSQGGDAWLESTPPFLLPFQAAAGLELTLGIGVDRLASYNADRQRRLIDMLNAEGVQPRLTEPRGAFFLIETPEPADAAARLRRAGVATDARHDPSGRTGFIRVCPDLLTTENDLATAAKAIARTIGPGIG